MIGLTVGTSDLETHGWGPPTGRIARNNGEGSLKYTAPPRSSQQKNITVVEVARLPTRRSTSYPPLDFPPVARLPSRRLTSLPPPDFPGAGDECRGLKPKHKSSRLSRRLFLLENGSCRVSLLSKRLSSSHAAFDRGKYDGQGTLRRHKFQNESCAPAANHALCCALVLGTSFA